MLSRATAVANSSTAPVYHDVGVFRGFIQPSSGNETTTQGGLREEYSHILYCDVSTPAQYGDRVQANGVTWRVVFAAQPTGISGVNHHKELLLRYQTS